MDICTGIQHGIDSDYIDVLSGYGQRGAVPAVASIPLHVRREAISDQSGEYSWARSCLHFGDLHSLWPRGRPAAVSKIHATKVQQGEAGSGGRGHFSGNLDAPGCIMGAPRDTRSLAVSVRDEHMATWRGDQKPGSDEAVIIKIDRQ